MIGREQFLGRGAQLAVMAELASRGYVVSMPEIDLGDDILVSRPHEQVKFRVQVKGRVPTNRPTVPVQFAQFDLPARQFQTKRTPELYYVFSLRRGNGWDSILISRRELLAMFLEKGRKMSHPDALGITFSFHKDRVLAMKRDFQAYRNNWNRYWPDLIAREKKGLPASE